MTGKYGCHDREPYRDAVIFPGGEVREFRMAKDCQYTLTELGQRDEKCEGCKWKKQKND